MAKQPRSQGLSVADDVVKQLYSGCDLTVQERQPVYLLHRDTIRAFLHEKFGHIAAESRCLAFLGIEISLVATLLTATFQDVGWLKGPVIQGTFIAFAIIVGILLAREAKRRVWGGEWVSPESLATELGARGAVITTKHKESAIGQEEAAPNPDSAGAP